MRFEHFGALVASLIFVAAANAQPSNVTMDARNLLDICTTAHPDSVGFCNGFMQAAHDWPAGDDLRACLPEGTTRTQLAMLYEEEAPALFAQDPMWANASGILVARLLMAQAYPCPE